MELLYIWQKLKTEKARIFLTIFAIAWSTLTIAIMLAVCHGFMQVSLGVFNRFGANALTVYPGQTSMQYKGVSSNTPVNFDIEDYQTIARALKNHIHQATPVYSMGTTLSILGKHRHASMLGVGQNYLSIKNLDLAVGRSFNQADLRERKPVVILGNDIASRLFVDPDEALNQYVFIRRTAYLVIGVTAKKGRFDFFSRQAYMPYTTLLALYPDVKMNQMAFNLKTSHHMKQAKATVMWWIAKHHHLNPTDPSIVYIQNNQQMIQTVHLFFIGIQAFFAIVGVITLLAASLGITSVMFTAVKNDQVEIGLRMALGAKRGMVLRYYLLESMLITFLGGLLGFILSLLLIGIFNKLHITLSMLNHSEFSLSLSWGLFILILLILGLVGFFAAFFPARKAANVNPSVALNEAV